MARSSSISANAVQLPAAIVNTHVTLCCLRAAFVAMSFEHTVADMYLVTLSMVLGSGISMGE